MPITTACSGWCPEAIAVNPTTNRIYVTNFYNASLSVIDGNTNAILATLPLPVGAGVVAVDGTRNRVYVTNDTQATPGSTLTVIDGGTDRIVGSITVGSGPQAVAVDPGTNRIYAANADSRSVLVVDGKTLAVVGTVSLAAAPVDLAVDPDMQRIYVTEPTTASANTMEVIDGKTNTLRSPAAVGHALGVAVNPATHLVYVPDYLNGTLAVIDGAHFD